MTMSPAPGYVDDEIEDVRAPSRSTEHQGSNRFAFLDCVQICFTSASSNPREGVIVGRCLPSLAQEIPHTRIGHKHGFTVLETLYEYVESHRAA
jgi:hypothetical protein